MASDCDGEKICKYNVHSKIHLRISRVTAEMEKVHTFFNYVEVQIFVQTKRLWLIKVKVLT